MRWIRRVAIGMIVNPSTKILQPPHLFEPLGVHNGKPKKVWLNIRAATLLDRCRSAHNSPWLGLLATATHTGEPVAGKCSFGSSFTGRPQSSILGSGVNWGLKVQSARGFRDLLPWDRFRTRPDKTFHVRDTAAELGHKHCMVSKGLKVQLQIHKAQRKFWGQPQIVLSCGCLASQLHRGACTAMQKVLHFNPTSRTQKRNQGKLMNLKIPITGKETGTWHSVQVINDKIQKLLCLRLGIHMCFSGWVSIDNGACDPSRWAEERTNLNTAGLICICRPWDSYSSAGERGGECYPGISSSIATVGTRCQRGTSDHSGET